MRVHMHVCVYTHTGASLHLPLYPLTREYSSILESIALGIQEYKELTSVCLSE